MATARLPIDAAHRAALTGIHGIIRKGASLTSIGLGQSALANCSNDQSTAVGSSAGAAATSGITTAFGYQAGLNTTTGGGTYFGYLAGNANVSGVVTAFGQRAGMNHTAAGYSTYFGHDAGRYVGASGTTGFTGGSYNTYFGYSTRGSANGCTNETALGNEAFGGGSNTVRLGNAAVTNWLPGVTNVCALGNATTAFKELYLHDGTDEWKVTINTSGALVTAKV